jgi:uncharacterized damage-inducible protein DinB
MDILNRLLGHDEWTTTQLLRQCATLSPAQWQQPFDVGYGSLCETFDHLVDNVEAWTDLMLERPVRDIKGNTPAQLLRRWQAAYAEFAALARALQEQHRLDDCYTDRLDNPPKQKTFGGTILHIITHSHQHRAEAIHILNHLGLPDVIEGDVLSWEQGLAP